MTFVKVRSVPSFLFLGHDHIYKQQDKTQMKDRLLYQKFLIEFEQHKVNFLFNCGRFHIDPADMDKVNDWYQQVVDQQAYERKAVEDFNTLRQKAKEKQRLEYIQEQQKKAEAQIKA